GLVAPADIVILRGEGVTLDRPDPRAADGLLEGQPRERRPLVLVVFERQVAEPEELPPRGLVLAPMPFEQMRHEPARVLLRRPLALLDRQVREQLVHHALRLLGGRGDLAARLAALGLG